MAKYKAYPEYKDSGVEWLGEIPIHWKMLRHKYVAFFTKGKNPTNLFEKPLKNTLPYLSMECLRNNTTDKYALISNDVRVALEGQPLIIWDGSNAGEFIKGKSGILSSTMAAATLTYPLYSQYYWYLCISIEPEMRKNAVGMGIPHVNGDELKSISFGIPSIYEQKQVAEFLDHETAKIDNLIDKQKQLIEILKEKRQAVISNVVNIRSNERKTKLKNLVNMQTGYPFPSAKFKFSSDNSIALLRGVNVGVDSIKWDDVVYWDVSALDRLNEYLLVAGDIVFGMDRPWISSGTRVSEIKEQDLPCLLLQRVARIRSNIKSYQPFIKLCLSSNEFREYAEIDLTGVSVPHISPEQISNFYVKDIPFDQQVNLTKNALEKIEKIKIIQEMSEQTIQILQERRTALISAAVTGKIDVRDWVAPDTQDVEEPQEATA